jgi:4-hydroxy-4-methyl-2-oxoglutarate aldolase
LDTGCQSKSISVSKSPTSQSTPTYIVADRDGAVCIPKAMVLDVVTAVEAAIGKENKVRTAILAGEDPQRAYLKFGKF